MPNRTTWLLALLPLLVAPSALAQASASFPPLPGEEGTDVAPPAPVVTAAPPPAAPPPPVAPAAPPPPVAPVAAQTSPAPAAPAATPPYPPLDPSPYAAPAAAGGALGPRYLPYEPGMPIPDGYRVRRQRLRGLMVGGGLTFGVSYAYAFGAGASHGFENGETWLIVPVIGPFGALASRKLDKCNIDVKGATDVNDLVASEAEVEECFEDALKEAVRLAVITADGVLQTVGATLFVGGAAGGERRLERIKPRATVALLPLGRQGYGLGVRGTF